MDLRICMFVLCCIYTTAAQSNDIDKHPKWSLLPKECGKAKETQFRIFGGQDADLGQFPWLVRIFVRQGTATGFNCGGALIGKRHVVTAAHCGEDVKVLSIRAGEYNTKQNPDCDDYGCAPAIQDVQVLSYVQHPDWNIKTIQNDIALITLADDVQFSNYVQPLCLPGGKDFFKDYIPVGSVQLAGWGHSDKPGQLLPDILQFVNLQIAKMDYCTGFYPKTRLLSKQQICIGVPNGKDTCEGDSGGPVMQEIKVDNEYRYYLLGVVSFGSQDCGTAPAIYTSVRYYLPWILENL